MYINTYICSYGMLYNYNLYPRILIQSYTSSQYFFIYLKRKSENGLLLT